MNGSKGEQERCNRAGVSERVETEDFCTTPKVERESKAPCLAPPGLLPQDHDEPTTS